MRTYIYSSVLTVAITLLIVVFNWTNIKENGAIRTIFSRIIQPKPAIIPTPPPLEVLGQGARLPTAKELEEEKKFDAQQTELAGQWLKSPNAHQRIIGAEQLSAYESSLSEQRLADTLRYDAVPEVRKTAAQSLSAFKNLSDQTIDSLLEALSDANKNTRITALNTLFSYALLINTDTKKSVLLLTRLRKKLRTRHLNKDVRDNLLAFLKNQKPSTNAFFPPLPSQTIPIGKQQLPGLR